jgi:hypothetical protein
MTEIPHVIHQIFFGGEEAVPDDYRRYAATWREKHPAWRFEFWDAARCRDFLLAHYAAFVPIYDQYRHRIQRVDAVRYYILHHFGGVYLDMDIECLRPIDGLVADRTLLLGAHVGGYTNAVMGSVAGHPFWPRVFALLGGRHRRFARSAPLAAKLSMPMFVGYSTGPILLGDAFTASGLAGDPAVRVCPPYVFEPLAPQEGAPVDVSESYAVHHMSMHWLPVHQKLLSRLFNLIAKPYWRRRKKMDRRAAVDP